MKSRLRRVCGDALVSAAVLAIVLGVLMSVDVRVRERVELVLSSTSPGAIGGAGWQLREIASALFDAAATQSVEHAALMVFIGVATVLLLAMVRT